MNEEGFIKVLQNSMQTCNRELQNETIRQFNEGMAEFFDLLKKFLPQKYLVTITDRCNKFQTAKAIDKTIPIIEFFRALHPFENLINDKDERLITEHGDTILVEFTVNERKEWSELVPKTTRDSIMEHISELYYGANIYNQMKQTKETSVDEVKSMMNDALSAIQQLHSSGKFPSNQKEMMSFLSNNMNRNKEEKKE